MSKSVKTNYQLAWEALEGVVPDDLLQRTCWHVQILLDKKDKEFGRED